MKNLFDQYRNYVIAATQSLSASGKIQPVHDFSKVTVEPPRHPGHGDISSNAAMVLSAVAGVPPQALANLLRDSLTSVSSISHVQTAGPGFVNMSLKNEVWHECLVSVLTEGAAYGASAMGNGVRVNVEYVSANPTGPLHVAHARGAVFGDALAALLAKAGYAVTKEYYINDAGAQVDVLARSAYLRYREALGERIDAIPEGLYPGDYLKDVGQALAARDGRKWHDAPEADWLAPVRRFAIDALMQVIRDDLDALGVHQEVFTSERALVEAGGVDRALAKLQDLGVLYVGTLEPPKGKPIEDWEPRPQTLFRATDFGDDVDRPLKKSDGSWTYFAADIANHYDKFQRGFPVMIDVWGADHSGYVKRMQAAVKAITGGAGDLDVKVCQLVTLLRAGQPVKMSKRAGTFVTLREVVDEVGKDVVRFIMLTRKNDSPLEFDLAKVIEKSMENPVWYVQYAHARVRSVMRHAAEDAPALGRDPAALAQAPLQRLSDPAELGLIKLLAGWPRLVESAALAHEPHRVAFYLNDVAGAFHSLWNKGKDDASLRFLVATDAALTAARLALVQATAQVIASGLEIMGVTPVEEMR